MDGLPTKSYPIKSPSPPPDDAESHKAKNRLAQRKFQQRQRDRLQHLEVRVEELTRLCETVNAVIPSPLVNISTAGSEQHSQANAQARDPERKSRENKKLRIAELERRVEELTRVYEGVVGREENLGEKGVGQGKPEAPGKSTTDSTVTTHDAHKKATEHAKNRANQAKFQSRQRDRLWFLERRVEELKQQCASAAAASLHPGGAVSDTLRRRPVWETSHLPAAERKKVSNRLAQHKSRENKKQRIAVLEKRVVDLEEVYLRVMEDPVGGGRVEESAQCQAE
ncbi:hypothetical protein HDU98_011882 [Podochytrium sp. JEL0797]|nr:hypothetical protein HDU98_011882 [Podochytrium sp. JEL0797]